MTAQEAARPAAGDFDDLLANNREFAKHFDQQGFDGVAHAGVLIVTCMDSRIVPLAMVGLTFGDAKIIRTPGGRVTTSAMAAADDEVLIERIRQSSGVDASSVRFGASADQRRTLHRDVEKLRNHPLIADRAVVGGFYYDVDTGLLERWI